MGFQPLVANNKKDRAVAAITNTDVAFTLQSGNFGSPTYKIYLTLDATVDAQFEVVRATVNGTSVSQMERSNALNHPLAAGLGCEVRMSTPAEIMNSLMSFMESGYADIPSYLTATYVSATSFTLSGDWTSILTAGTRIRMTNSSTKYLVVASTSVTSNLTTIVGSGDTLTASAITGLSFIRNGSKVIYTELTSTFATTSTAVVQVTGLTGTISAETGRSYELEAFAPDVFNSSSSGFTFLSIWDGPVVTGTLLQEAVVKGTNDAGLIARKVVTPTGSKTYNVGLRSVGGGTATVSAASLTPAYLLIKAI